MTLVLASAVAVLAMAEAPPLLVQPGAPAAVVLDEGTQSDGTRRTDPVPPKGTQYRRVDLDGVDSTPLVALGAGHGSLGCGEETPNLVAFEPLPQSDKDYVLVAGTWPAAPAIQREPVSADRHGALITQVLMGSALNDHPVTGEVFSADLDADGTLEQLVIATNVEPGSTESRDGDVSLAFVARGPAAAPETVPLIIDRVSPGHGGASDNVPVTLKLIAIADLDGDGRMEVVLERSGYEYMTVEGWRFPANQIALPDFTYGCAP